MNSRRALVVTKWTLAVAALGGIVLVYHRWIHVNPTTVALTLLLFILVMAAEWGLRYAVVISLIATALYNFYFLPPLGTFTIVDPQNWLALFAFLTTAIIASRLSEKARDEAARAKARQRELEILFRLSSELMQTDSVTSLLTSIPSAVASVTAAKTGALYLIDGDRLYQAGANGDLVSEVEFPHLRHVSESLTSSRVDNEEIQIPIKSGVRARGAFLLRGVTLSMATADAIGGLISVSIDRVQALENVARSEATKEGERLRTLMIDSVTHELRTPLTSIKGAATALLQKNVPPEQTHELLTIIDEESDRLNQLVSEAVEMAQLDAQQVQLNLRTLHVKALVDAALHTCSWVAEHHPIVVDVQADDLNVRADENLMEKVLCNLVENAGKYSPEGTPITITASGSDDQVTISVADRGMGIDPMEQGLIFERFYRGRAGQSGPGTGMGLPISRAIMEAHGGSIRLTSQVGQGSVFSIVMPAEP